MVRMRMILLGLALLALGTGPALAAVFYAAELLPDLVQPHSGASAYGQATIVMFEAGSQMHLTLNFAGLASLQTAARLLVAAPDQPGVSVLELPLGSPLALTLDLTPDIATALADGELAIQIHSELWPEGAIRGNFGFVTVGVDVTSWTRVKGLFN
jgi:hypothetical protein